MKYELYCVVNAAGLPYYDTFRPSGEKSWALHRWRDVPKDGDHHDSCKIPTLEKHELDLRANGDRVAKVHIETSENVLMDFPE